jgi:hypothetical protein
VDLVPQLTCSAQPYILVVVEPVAHMPQLISIMGVLVVVVVVEYIIVELHIVTNTVHLLNQMVMAEGKV